MSNDLDEEIDKWLWERPIIERKDGKVWFEHKDGLSDSQNDWKNNDNKGGCDFTASGLRDFARHFYELGKQHGIEEMLQDRLKDPRMED